MFIDFLANYSMALQRSAMYGVWMSSSNHAFRSAGAKTEGVYKHSVPLGLRIWSELRPKNRNLKRITNANSLLLAHCSARLNRRSI